MKLLTSMLKHLSEYRAFLTAIDNGGCPAAVAGLALIHRAHFIAALRGDTARPVAVVCADEHEAIRLSEDLTALTGFSCPLLAAREFLFHAGAVASRQWEHKRISLFHNLMEGSLPLLVCTVEGLLQRTMPPDLFRHASRTLRADGSYDLNELADFLARAGYTRCEQVEGVGQFALRGGILDIFSPAHPSPARVEFWDADVDSMGLFDVNTQRRIGRLESLTILPVAEVLPGLTGGELARVTDCELPQVYGKKVSTAAHYLPADTVVCFSENSRVAERGKNWLWQLDEDVKGLLEQGMLDGKNAAFSYNMDQLIEVLSDFPICYLDSFIVSQYPIQPRTVLNVIAKQLPSWGASLETAAADLLHYQQSGMGTVVLVSSERRALDLQSLLREHKVRSAVDFALHDLPGQGGVTIAVGGLSAGFEYPGAKLAVLTEGRPVAVKQRHKSKEQDSARRKLDSYADLSPGDLVVHEHHGVGRFVGMVKMPVDGIEKDYIKLAYAGADVLYVPATQLDLVSKYIGGGEDTERKKLSKLGGADWERAKSRTRKAVADLAKGLIELYAQRQREPGFAFSPDSPWMRQFEDEFEYAETDDQLRCIAEVKRDMETARPMDRLLCGDVGYGKTEVAFRAIMKCVLDGKQAAILVPTTVLARQHYLNAKRRFSGYPVEIEVVSRFRTPGQMRKALDGVTSGKVDLLIGTHRLLQKDVKFKDLGLLVVDEEQRFGVTHKEKLKELAKQVDVLTLSATPIPRTLNMALSGIRDMSALEEPPQGRQPVQTYVLEHDWSMLADAMRREIERGGQVYYLHNRVETITRAAARIKDMLGEEVSVAVAHGKMTEDEINDVMTAMTDAEIQVLVCTTIIETGIDIANVNTLIIEDADKMGLAQLHQLRGRVGRSPRRAYAYLTYRQGKVLTEIAAKRLSAIREFAEFGSGFKIAMRDLEIRGAGNVLGPEQSGFLMSVGYDLYLKLLEEAVLTQQGKPVPPRTECAADLSVAASIPDRYVPAPEQRMDLYRRIARIRTEEEADDMVDELVDRYGDPPRQVNNLISVALLRGRAAACGVTAIDQKKDSLELTLDQFDLEAVSALCGQFSGRMTMRFGEQTGLTIKLRKNEDVLRLAGKIVEEYEKLRGVG